MKTLPTYPSFANVQLAAVRKISPKRYGKRVSKLVSNTKATRNGN